MYVKMCILMQHVKRNLLMKKILQILTYKPL